MFHDFDSSPTAAAPSRAQWLATLARASVEQLEVGLGNDANADVRWLRAPETGLMMVQGRAGGSGERFNLGEVTVTRCALRLAEAGAARQSIVGVAYVLGRSKAKVRLAAIADALLQDPGTAPVLQARLLAPVRRQLAQAQAERDARAQASRVEFFTVAREAGGAAEEDIE